MQKFAFIRAVLALCIGGAVTLVGAALSKAIDAQRSQSCTPIGNSTINVRDFGAKGDGRTDDTVALNNAMARLAYVLSCGASHDGKLFFPPGTYIVGSALSLSQSSQSWHSVSIGGDGVVGTVLETAQKSGIFVFRFTKQVPLTISDLTLVGDIPHAGAAISVSMPAAPKAGGTRSMVVQDVSILGKENGVGYFDHGLKGEGLTDPLLNGIRIIGPALPGAGAQYTYGSACVSLTGGWGAEIENPSSCNLMAIGLDLKQLGGMVIVHARNFGVGANYGIMIDAGSGMVEIEGTHVNSATMGIDITNATAVTLADNLFLTFDDTAAGGHGSISVDNSSNISIFDNVLWHSARATNPNRTGINIGRGDRIVVVAGNTINELGTGIAIASGVAGARILYNRFYGQANDIADSGTRTLVRRLQSEPGTSSQ